MLLKLRADGGDSMNLATVVCNKTVWQPKQPPVSAGGFFGVYVFLPRDYAARRLTVP